MKKTIYILAATAMLILGSSKLQAQCNLGYTGPMNLYVGSNSSYSPGQSFTASCSGAIDAISLAVFQDEDDDGNPITFDSVNATLSIYTGDGNGGTLIYNQPFNISPTPSSIPGPNQYDYTILLNSAKPTLTSGSVYTFFIKNSNVKLQMGFNYNNPYTDGRAYVINNGFLSGFGFSYDLFFNVQIAPSCTPTTSNTDAFICKGGTYTLNGISYSKPGKFTQMFTNAAGCDSTVNLNLNDLGKGLPNSNGAKSICVGSSVTFTNAISGGVWSSLNNRATVNASGVVTGSSQGTALIKYAITSGGCNTSTTASVIVNGLPNVPSIGYAAGTLNPQKGPGGAFCTNRTFTLVGTPSGGEWSSTGALSIDPASGDATTGNTGGAASVTYTYTNANGCSNSRTIAGTVATCASRGVNGGSSEQLVASGFTMYPNPAKSFIRLNVETLIGAGRIVVTDLYGKQVKAQSLSMGTNTIDIATLTKGIYLVSIITNEGKTTKKLVVE